MHTTTKHKVMHTTTLVPQAGGKHKVMKRWGAWPRRCPQQWSVL